MFMSHLSCQQLLGDSTKTAILVRMIVSAMLAYLSVLMGGLV